MNETSIPWETALEFGAWATSFLFEPLRDTFTVPFEALSTTESMGLGVSKRLVEVSIVTETREGQCFEGDPAVRWA